MTLSQSLPAPAFFEGHLWPFPIPPSPEPKRARELRVSREAKEKLLIRYESSDSLSMSLSHSGDFGVYLITSHLGCGVDIQRKEARSQLSRIVARQIGIRTLEAPSWNSHLCYRLWCFSEAYYKATQKLLHYSEIDFSTWQKLKSLKSEFEFQNLKVFFGQLAKAEYQLSLVVPQNIRSFRRFESFIR